MGNGGHFTRQLVVVQAEVVGVRVGSHAAPIVMAQQMGTLGQVLRSGLEAARLGADGVRGDGAGDDVIAGVVLVAVVDWSRSYALGRRVGLGGGPLAEDVGYGADSLGSLEEAGLGLRVVRADGMREGVARDELLDGVLLGRAPLLHNVQQQRQVGDWRRRSILFWAARVW